MTATDELRRLLDEAGIEWHDTKIGRGFITVYEHDGITWIVTEHSSGRLSVKGCVKPTQGHYDGMTPEQAIAATLGSGTCHKVRVHKQIEDEMHCSKCGRFLGFAGDVGAPPYNFCPNCGRKVVDE